VLIADTGYELYAACETVRDLNQLYADLGVADEVGMGRCIVPAIRICLRL
jgi:hypothetical protein